MNALPDPVISPIRRAILGAYPPGWDPFTPWHIRQNWPRPPLSPLQEEALAALKAARAEWFAVVQTEDAAHAAACQQNQALVTVKSPRRALARVAMRLLRIGFNARDLLRQLDTANARLSSPLPAAAVRDMAIWAAHARQGATRAAR